MNIKETIFIAYYVNLSLPIYPNCVNTAFTVIRDIQQLWYHFIFI